MLGRAADDGGELDLPIYLLRIVGHFDGLAGVGERARGLDEVPGLQVQRVRIGLRRPAMARVHLGDVVGVVRAGAVDGGRPAHRREQLCARERLALDPALARVRRRFPECRLRGLPIVEDAEHGGIGGLAGELCGIEQLVAHDQAGAGAGGRLVGCEPVAGRGRFTH